MFDQGDQRHSLFIVRSIFKELLCIIGLTFIGAAYGLLSGLSPKPWAKPELPAGAIHFADANVLNPIWLDARPVELFEQGHIEGALWLDPEDWESGIPTLMDTWLQNPRPIVIYCSSETCNTSRSIAKQMRDALPQAEIYYMEGGWSHD